MILDWISDIAWLAAWFIAGSYGYILVCEWIDERHPPIMTDSDRHWIATLAKNGLSIEGIAHKTGYWHSQIQDALAYPPDRTAILLPTQVSRAVQNGEPIQGQYRFPTIQESAPPLTPESRQTIRDLGRQGRSVAYIMQATGHWESQVAGVLIEPHPDLITKALAHQQQVNAMAERSRLRGVDAG